jgi:hypothetical protein
MEELIKQAFLHVDVIGPHVHEGHYDLVGPDGEIILPQVWETMIQPDWAVTMHMWPLPEPPPSPSMPSEPPESRLPHSSTSSTNFELSPSSASDQTSRTWSQISRTSTSDEDIVKERADSVHTPRDVNNQANQAELAIFSRSLAYIG